MEQTKRTAMLNKHRQTEKQLKVRTLKKLDEAIFIIFILKSVRKNLEGILKRGTKDKKMRKIVATLAIVMTLLFIASPVKARGNFLNLPPWFTEAIQPIQETLDELISRVTNLEENRADDFEVPGKWGAEFYFSDDGETYVAVIPWGLRSDSNGIPDHGCFWQDRRIGPHVTVRAIAHLPEEDTAYGVGTCELFWLMSTDHLPLTGTSFPVDVFYWWQGKSKTQEITLTVPDRPFLNCSEGKGPYLDMIENSSLCPK